MRAPALRVQLVAGTQKPWRDSAARIERPPDPVVVRPRASLTRDQEPTLTAGNRPQSRSQSLLQRERQLDRDQNRHRLAHSGPGLKAPLSRGFDGFQVEA